MPCALWFCSRYVKTHLIKAICENSIAWQKKNMLPEKFSVFKWSTLESEILYGNRKPFKDDEKWFLFHAKSSFRLWDISIFVLTFSLYRKNGLIRKLRLIRKFMTSFSEAANQKHLIISAMNYSLQNVMHMELVYRIWANSWLLIKQKTKNKDWR